MSMIRLIENCYQELDLIRTEIRNQKAKAGQPTKTTFSEIVRMLIKHYRATTKVQDVTK